MEDKGQAAHAHKTSCLVGRIYKAKDLLFRVVAVDSARPETHVIVEHVGQEMTFVISVEALSRYEDVTA